MKPALEKLAAQLAGELHLDQLSRAIYATDGSIYREWPLAVAVPRTQEDLQLLIAFARQHGVALIPRTAGTSLAGQCVGPGIVVDVSKYFNRILEWNPQEQWVLVEPGVIRDELNHFLQPHGYFFGPNTSTANRAMIGGMVGNNSCGTTSIVYGSTRDHVLELHCLLSDGSSAVFGPLTASNLTAKMAGNTLEAELYRQIYAELSEPTAQVAIREGFPKPSIHRRNTGYAVDLLLRQQPFDPAGPPFNFATMLCGSEGTLAITTAIKIHVDPLPPPAEVVVVPHFSSINECMEAVLIAMAHQPYACEMMDRIILDCTKDNLEQQKNRFFLSGDPAAVLMIELRDDTLAAAEAKADALIADLQRAGYGFHFPKVFAPQTKNVFALRAAGFGVLSNLKGDAKALEFVEDTAVELADLPAYIAEFGQLMEAFQQRVVYYAHAGAGELHLRPTVNLKTSAGVRELRAIAEASAQLVKKYRGSLSGEHGDGRVRGEFIPYMLGESNYQLLRRIKQTWDPPGIFNPGKIVDAPPMDTALRHEADVVHPPIATVFDYSDTAGILNAVEKCNGSGDCRKLAFSGGTMCPSYMATRNEKDTTRARANALREFLTLDTRENPFNHPEIKEAMDLCLSCKGCKAECPSNVDMATLKAEFLYHYHQANGTPWRDRLFANIGQLNSYAALVPSLSNAVMGGRLSGGLIKSWLGIAPARSLPPVARSLRRWYQKNRPRLQPQGTPRGQVYFFGDEFTNYNDPHIGQHAIELLVGLGYQVTWVAHPDSGRAHFSKGLLREARKLARQNVAIFQPLISPATPLVGVEPSAILSFRDEYPRLVDPDQQEAAQRLGQSAMLVEDFLAQEAAAGRLEPADFASTPRHILLHAHCHQKALAGSAGSAQALSLPPGHTVELIPAGCCGMAGSFGYEKEHYAVSMEVGELVLFPALRQAPSQAVIAAPGTSCRHQIWDGVGKKAHHPVTLLWEALPR